MGNRLVAFSVVAACLMSLTPIQSVTANTVNFRIEGFVFSDPFLVGDPWAGASKEAFIRDTGLSLTEGGATFEIKFRVDTTDVGTETGAMSYPAPWRGTGTQYSVGFDIRIGKWHSSGQDLWMADSFGSDWGCRTGDPGTGLLLGGYGDDIFVGFCGPEGLLPSYSLADLASADLSLFGSSDPVNFIAGVPGMVKTADWWYGLASTSFRRVPEPGTLALLGLGLAGLGFTRRRNAN